MNIQIVLLTIDETLGGKNPQIKAIRERKPNNFTKHQQDSCFLGWLGMTFRLVLRQR